MGKRLEAYLGNEEFFNHPWTVGQIAALVASALKLGILPKDEGLKIMEIGAGSGELSYLLKKLFKATVTAVEMKREFEEDLKKLPTTL